MLNATAIYITPGHSCQVCLLPIFRSVWPKHVMENLENNRAPFLNYVKLFASFQRHRWIGSGEYALFSPQPPGSLVSWGTVAKNVKGLYKTIHFMKKCIKFLDMEWRARYSLTNFEDHLNKFSF